MALEEAKHKKKMDQQRELIEQQLKFQKALEANQEIQQAQVKPAAKKLPKLSITKFDGKFASWLSFWNKFEAEIDSTALPPVTKFAYLKELVEPKVKTDIDGLPLTSEGYERAKNILKNEYVKTSEIVNAYVQNILGLPVVTTAHPREVNQFYKTLLHNVQSLETPGKIERVNGMTRSVLDKLEAMKEDLVRGHEDWQEWDLPRLVIALKKWKDVDPCDEENSGTMKDDPPSKREKNKFPLFQTDARKCPCVYCDNSTHASRDCTRVPTPDERKKILAQKGLCFNCTETKHRAADCKCKNCCLKCGQRHYTSICSGRNQLLITSGEKKGRVVYPVVMVSVEGVLCRALLDTGAGSPYASAALLAKLSKRTHAREVRHIETMLGSTTREVELATITVRSTDGKEELKVDATKVEKGELLMLENPYYQALINSHAHLEGVQMENTDPKPYLPIHLILGASEYAAIKTTERPRVGQPGEPVAEKTEFGWTIMSPGREIDHTNMLLTQTSHVDYEKFCRLDVMGLQDVPKHDQRVVMQSFENN